MLDYYISLSEMMIQDGVHEVNYSLEDWEHLSPDKLYEALIEVLRKGIDSFESLDEVHPYAIPLMKAEIITDENF